MANALAVLAVNVAEVPVRVRRFLDTAPVAFPSCSTPTGP